MCTTMYKLDPLALIIMPCTLYVCNYFCIRYEHCKHDIMVFRKKLYFGSPLTW